MSQAPRERSRSGNPRKRSRDDQETPDDRMRVPPQNLDAERGVLGSILLLNEAIDEVGETLRPDHFYSDANQKIFAAIQALYEEGIRGIDAITLAEELIRRNQFEEIGGASYLAEILEAVPHAAHVRYYANIVREKWMLRTLIFTCTEILGDSYAHSEDVEELLQSAEKRIFGILEEQSGGGKIAIGDILMETFNRLDERMQKSGDVTGVTTGFTDLDRQTTAFSPRNSSSWRLVPVWEKRPSSVMLPKPLPESQAKAFCSSVSNSPTSNWPNDFWRSPPASTATTCEPEISAISSETFCIRPRMNCLACRCTSTTSLAARWPRSPHWLVVCIAKHRWVSSSSTTCSSLNPMKKGSS